MFEVQIFHADDGRGEADVGEGEHVAADPRVVEQGGVHAFEGLAEVGEGGVDGFLVETGLAHFAVKM